MHLLGMFHVKPIDPSSTWKDVARSVLVLALLDMMILAGLLYLIKAWW